MAETLTSLQNAVLHSLARTPASTTSTTAIVNDAKEYFCNSHDWRWKDKALSLDTVSAQNYIALPSDFEQLISIRSGTSNMLTVMPASLDEIMTLRQLNSGVGGYYYYCVSWTAQASVTSAPLGRLELYPTPSASTVGVFAGKYRRKIPDLSSGTDAPDIPTYCHSALKQMVRAWAMWVEEQKRDSDWELANIMLERCIQMDGTTQVLLGMPSYRVGTNNEDEASDIRFYPYNFISAP